MTPPACENCGTQLLGEYCHVCGQRVLPRGRVTVWQALEVSASDLINVEPKTVRSMRRLFVPGALTAEYLSGHRAPFTAPIKLYLACAAVFFIFTAYTGFSLEQMMAQDTTGQFRAFVEREIAASGLAPEVFSSRFDSRLQAAYTVGLALPVFASAAMLALLFRRQRRTFGSHVIFELHYVSFLYLVTIGLGLAYRFVSPGQPWSFLMMLAVLVPYQFTALRRVYGERPRTILWKTAAMILFALVFDNLVNLAVVFLSVKLV